MFRSSKVSAFRMTQATRRRGATPVYLTTSSWSPTAATATCSSTDRRNRVVSSTWVHPMGHQTTRSVPVSQMALSLHHYPTRRSTTNATTKTKMKPPSADNCRIPSAWRASLAPPTRRLTATVKMKRCSLMLILMKRTLKQMVEDF